MKGNSGTLFVAPGHGLEAGMKLTMRGGSTDSGQIFQVLADGLTKDQFRAVLWKWPDPIPGGPFVCRKTDQKS